MRTSRIKIAEDGSIPVVVRLFFLLEFVALRLDVVCDDGFDSCFRATIGIRRGNRAMFRDRNHVREASRIAVDGSGGGENDVGYIVFGHRTE